LEFGALVGEILGELRRCLIFFALFLLAFFVVLRILLQHSELRFLQPLQV
jgi:hypothetical protein